MTIQNLLATYSADVRSTEFNDRIDDILTNFTKTINANTTLVQNIVDTYKAELSTQNKAFFDTFQKSIFIQQYDKHNLLKEVMKRGKSRISMSEQLFTQCALYEISLLIAKYTGSVSEAQVKLGLMKMVFDHAQLYNINIDYVLHTSTVIPEPVLTNLQAYINNVLNLDISYLTDFDNSISKQYSLNYNANTNIDQLNLKKPRKPEHLVGLWNVNKDLDGNSICNLTRAQRIQAVMDYYKCSKPTAISWMKQFGVYDSVEYTDFEALYVKALKTIDELKTIITTQNEEIKRLHKCIDDMF